MSESEIEELENEGPTVPPVEAEHARKVDEQIEELSDYHDTLKDYHETSQRARKEKLFTMFFLFIPFGLLVIAFSLHYSDMFYMAIPFSTMALAAQMLFLISGISLLTCGIIGSYKNRDNHIFYLSHEDN